MKKLLISLLFIISIYSCKESTYDDNYVSDEVIEYPEIIVDSAAAVVEYEDIQAIDSVPFVQEPVYEEIEEPVQIELTFEDVARSNSIKKIKEFISKNPEHENIDELNRRIIDLEVDKIYNDKKTGKMPSSDRINYSNSSTSSITITNDTSCELTIRYSGSDSKIITIRANGSKTVNINSGNYRIAATACGYNYAGTENLSGDYTSSYYISTTRH
ncbi:MAG: DUF6759 domain-containing protein [Flavobacterium sp.]|jgi:hypothetical protein